MPTEDRRRHLLSISTAADLIVIVLALLPFFVENLPSCGSEARLLDLHLVAEQRQHDVGRALVRHVD